MGELVLYALIVLLCGAAGWIKAQGYSDRVELLTDLIHVFKILENEMRYRMDPLTEVLMRVGSYKRNKACDLLLETAERLRENRASFEIYWCGAIDEIYGKSPLLYEDLAVVKDMGIEFGKSNMLGQSNMFSLVNLRLNEQLAAAVAENATKGKLYRSVGFVIGVVIVILLI